MTVPERRPGSVAAVGLGAALDAFSDEVNGLTRAVREQTRAWRLALFLLAVAVGQTFWLVHITQLNNRAAVDNHRVLEIVRDATTPGGKLYQDGQSRTGDAVRRILVCDRAYLDSATTGAPIPKECP